MIVLPIAAALVSLVFGVHLLVRFGRRGNLFEGVWAVALLMYAIASGALAFGVLDGWSSAEFRTYWLFGALLNVPYLAQGEVYLLVRPQWVGHAVFGVLLLATVWATVEVRTASLDEEVLATREFFSGRQVLEEGSAALELARPYSIGGYVVLVAGALWSAWRTRGRRELRNRFHGILLIVLGATVVFAGSAFARGANFGGFSLLLTAGVAVMYWGFLMASRPRHGVAARAGGAERPAKT
ncbi:MAG: hypothetical protein ACRDIX_07400 [Actinomycetota bacterium]